MPLSAQSIHTDITNTLTNSKWLKPLQLCVPEVIQSFRDLHHTLGDIRLNMHNKTRFANRQALEDEYLAAFDRFFFSFRAFYRFNTQQHCSSICIDLFICKEDVGIETQNMAQELFALNFGITNAIRMVVQIPLIRYLNTAIETILYPSPVVLPTPPIVPAMPRFSPDVIALFTQPSAPVPAKPQFSEEVIALFTQPSAPAPAKMQFSKEVIALFTQPSAPAPVAKPVTAAQTPKVVPQLPPLSPAVLALFTQPSIPAAKPALPRSDSNHENMPLNTTSTTVAAGRRQRAGRAGP